MSSSNRIRIAVIEETTYGETPVAGNFETARVTSDSLSGTPETTESKQIRTDRLSSGQITTGLTVSGDLNGELAKEDIIDEFIESAMFSTFASDTPVSITLDINATNKTIDRSAGDFNSDVAIGDVLTLAGFANSENNTEVMVASIESATQIKYIGPSDMVTEAGDADESFVVADKIEIGTTKKSFSMEKAFLDLTDKAINYRGQIANTMSLSVSYGNIVTFTFGFVGNDYEPVEASGDFMTDSRTINDPATSQSMNGSIDLSFLGESAGGTFSGAAFCIQGVDINLNNNLTPKTCIGQAAPTDYTEGTAQIEITVNAYMSDSTWGFLSKKQTQESFALGFLIKNDDGFYGFYLPAIQLSFEDPAIAGQNEDVMINMTGRAKVGANGEKSLAIYKG